MNSPLVTLTHRIPLKLELGVDAPLAPTSLTEGIIVTLSNMFGSDKPSLFGDLMGFYNQFQQANF